MALDHISTPTLVEDIPPMGKILFCINGDEADASTAIEIKATPGAGKAIYITYAILQSDDADAHPHLQDEDGNILFGPLMSTVEGASITKEYTKIKKLVNNKALQLKAAAAGNVFVYVEGGISTG
jgi:hypothetical protein